MLMFGSLLTEMVIELLCMEDSMVITDGWTMYGRCKSSESSAIRV